MTTFDTPEEKLEQIRLTLKEESPELAIVPAVLQGAVEDDKPPAEINSATTKNRSDKLDDLKPWKTKRSLTTQFVPLTPEALNDLNVYARFSRRLLAYLADWCIVTTICACVFAAWFGGPLLLVPFWLTVGIITFIPGSPIWFVVWMIQTSGYSLTHFLWVWVSWEAGMLLTVGALVIDAGYYAIMESSSTQATFGKRLLRMHVTDINGNRLRLWRAFLRYFAKPINLVCLIVAFVGIDWDKKQAYHDQIARTYVLIQLKLTEESPQPEIVPAVHDETKADKLQTENNSTNNNRVGERDELKPWKKKRSLTKRFTVPAPETLGNHSIYSSFSRRLGAYLVDWCIVNTICACVFATLFGGPLILIPIWLTVTLITFIPGSPIWSVLLMIDGAVTPSGTFAHFLWLQVSWEAAMLLTVGALLIDSGYYAIMESSSTQATFGKRLLRMHVTNTNGNRLSLWRALQRYVVKPINLVCLIVAFVGIDWDKKQAYHDQIAHTYVLNDDLES